ncbi:MAG: hypothetical protein AAF497_14255 [Planctomycetota bacterium]
MKRTTLTLIVLSVALLLGFARPVCAQAVDAFAYRRAADEAFTADLEKLAVRCESQGQDGLAQATRAWHIPRHSGRQYLFTGELPEYPTPDKDDSFAKRWREYFEKVRHAQADRLWKLAKAAIREEEPERAIQLMYEVLRERPEDRQVRKALGLGKFDSGRETSQKYKPQLARSTQQAYGWPARKYWRLQTDHFTISTNHSAEAAAGLARRLESFYDIWQQVFVRFWTTPAAVRQTMSKRGLKRRGGARHNVVLFRDRSEYVNYLRQYEPQADITLGVYRDKDRVAYFFAGDDSLRTTWRHEVSHQLFQESLRKGHTVAEEHNFWLIEGIALYLESLKKHDGFYTLGGFESERLQFARYRALSDKFYVPLSELVPLGRHELQQDPRLRRLYSQAAGLTHFLMDGDGAAYRNDLVEILRSQYEGKDRESMLEDVTGKSLQSFDDGYRAYLNVTDEDMASLERLQGVRKLALGHTQVTDQGLRFLSGQDNLDWLDVTACDVSDEGLGCLAKSLPLRQLNLERTSVTDASAERLAGWPLVELDLSHTQVTDQSTLELRRLADLKVLWLTATKISNQGLERLSGLRKLEHLDVSQTAVSQSAWRSFCRNHPGIKQSSTGQE